MTEQEWLECNRPQKILEELDRLGLLKAWKVKALVLACCLENENALMSHELKVIRRAEAGAGGGFRDVTLADRPLFGLLSSVYNDEPRTLIHALFHLENRLRGFDGQPELFAHSQVKWIRDIWGNPFRKVKVSWNEYLRLVGWQGYLLPGMARRIREEKDFADMGVLGDALEDAGCEDAEVLEHCRDRREHCKGCWLLNWLTLD